MGSIGFCRVGFTPGRTQNLLGAKDNSGVQLTISTASSAVTMNNRGQIYYEVTIFITNAWCNVRVWIMQVNNMDLIL